VIRDPSDGSVREIKFRSGLVPGMGSGNEGVSERRRPPQGIASAPCTGNAAQPLPVESGLAPLEKDRAERLKRSREWLENYHRRGKV